MSASAPSANSAKEVVLSFVNAINREDFAAARRLASDDLSFVGVLGSRDSADAYFQDMQRMRLKYDVKKVFADGDDVCLLCDLSIAGQTIFLCSWYRVERGKIRSLRVLFDPRPLLDPAK
jgi:limonene-1,2-epoxide hydrolase